MTQTEASAAGALWGESMATPLDRAVPEPKFNLSVDTAAKTLTVNHMDNALASIPLEIGTIHSLFDAIDGSMLFDGLSLRISRKGLATPLGFEALLQTVMMSMVSCIFPRVNRTFSSPLRQKLSLHSMDAETNYIRNAAYLNSLNHVHILKDKLAGLPILVAFPGPSLDVEYVREHRDSFVVLAVGRAAGKLLKEEVYPDFIYIQDVNSKAWKGSFDFLGETKTPCTLIANPLGEIWKYAKNFKRVFKAWNLYQFEADVFPKIEEIAPSAVSGAYSLARLLGGGPMVLVGNDCGATVPKPEDTTLPEALTNLEYDTDGDDLIIAPNRKRHDLRFSFGDEFSIITQSDYIAGAQWLKMRAARDMNETGIEIYDRSSTRVSQFNSPIRDASNYVPSGTVSVPDLPGYKSDYDMGRYLRHKKQFFSFLHRQLSNGVVPDSALKRPGSCVFDGTLTAHSDSVNPGEDDIRIAARNAATLSAHAEEALVEIGA